MKYVQFYKKGTNKWPVEKLGTDGVFIVDGRWSLQTIHDKVSEVLQKAPYLKDVVAYEVFKGASFRRSVSISIRYKR